jgi:hypothetical protein
MEEAFLRVYGSEMAILCAKEEPEHCYTSAKTHYTADIEFVFNLWSTPAVYPQLFIEALTSKRIEHKGY